jgi:PAS domain S-box-containing protein
MNQKKYDAVISDYQMTDMDGIQFLKQVRTSGNTVPFIVFTGRGREEVIIQALNEGADFYLQKGGDPAAQFAELTNKVQYAITRRRAEEALRESEERYRLLTENTEDIVWQMDLSMTFSYVSPSSLQQFGYAPGEIVGKRLMDIITPASAASIRDEMMKRRGEDPGLINQGSATYIVEFVRRDGSTVLAEVITNPVFSAAGTLAGWSGITRDINRHRKIRELLGREEEPESSLGRILNTLGDPVFVRDEQHRTVLVNDAFCTFTGRPRDGIVGKSDHELFPKDLAEHFFREDERVFSSGTGHVIEEVVPDNTGRAHIFATKKTLFTDGAGNRYVVGISRDITDEKRTERELLIKNALFAAQNEVAIDAILVVDENQKILLHNRCFLDMWGIPPGLAMAGNDARLSGYITGKIKEPVTFLSKVAYLYAHREVKSRDEIALADGRFLDRYSSPMFGPDGKYFGRIWYFRDITEQKKTEDALRAANRKLGLLSGITRHDINNQMTVLNGYLGILQNKQHDPADEKYFSAMEAAAHRISGFIRTTQEYEEIGVQLPRWQDIRTIVAAAAKEASPGNIVIYNDLPPCSEIFADPLVTRVFYNLIDNAVRHGGTTSTIRFFREESGEDFRIICEDDGAGVPADEKIKIFERNFGKNTGLGLFLARQILEITGITICETGVQGTGARFEMTVPAKSFRSGGPDTPVR